MNDSTRADGLFVPLHDRVTAPQSLALPEGPQGVTWRALRDDDVSLVADLESRIASRDHPSWSQSLEEVREELAHTWVDASSDGVLAVDDDGTALAWGLVVTPPDPDTLVRAFLFGGVDPAHRGRGIGRRLLEWQRGRALQKLAALEHRLPAWILSYAPDLAPEHGSLLQRAGFSAARWFTTLECDLRAATPESPPPPGVTLDVFTPARSEATRAAKNAAFADHWGSQPTTREQWESTQSLPTFRADLSRIALAGDEVVGFVVTEVNEADWERLGASSGYISLVGTVREWRGRGLAASMLSAVLDAYRSEGLQRAVLDVDTENPTGALGVYTRLGFAATSRDVAYRIEV